MNSNLLQRFYKGECSEEEVREVQNWFSSREQKEVLLEQLEAEWDQFEASEEEVGTGYNPENILQGIHNRLNREEVLARAKQQRKSIRSKRSYSLRIAAIVTLAIISSLAVQMFLIEPQAEKESILLTETPSGEKRTIKLTDGTIVILNAESRLSYPEKFSKDKREIALEGEAFFKVAPDRNRPFTVISDKVRTTVLGTSFNIRAYQDEQNIQVAVASGKVKVNYEGEAHYLLPGKMVNYDAVDHAMAVTDFNEEEVLSWKDGVLHFKDARFEEVIQSLERWYGVEIETTGQTEQDWEYTGIFKRQSLENVLMSIGYVKHFNYKLEGRKVEIIFKSP